MRVRSGQIVGALACTLMGSCADTGTDPQGNPLTSTEVDVLMDAIGGTLDALSPASDGRISQTLPCAPAGDILVSGALTQTNASAITLDITFLFRKCQQDSEAGLFVLNGSLHETGSVVTDASAQTFTVDLRMAGSVTWSLDKNRSGSCDFDYRELYQYNGPTGTESNTVTGTICGVPQT